MSLFNLEKRPAKAAAKAAEREAKAEAAALPDLYESVLASIDAVLCWAQARPIERYEDQKIIIDLRCVWGAGNRYVVDLKTTPIRQRVLDGCHKESMSSVTFRPGKWIEYIKDELAPQAIAERDERARLQQAKEALRHQPIDDSELFD